MLQTNQGTTSKLGKCSSLRRMHFPSLNHSCVSRNAGVKYDVAGSRFNPDGRPRPMPIRPQNMFSPGSPFPCYLWKEVKSRSSSPPLRCRYTALTLIAPMLGGWVFLFSVDVFQLEVRLLSNASFLVLLFTRLA